jgi:alpha-L-fucosidase
MKRALILACLILALAALLPARARGDCGGPRPNLKPNGESLEKWMDLRFGLFIHWGPVTLRGTEIGWSRGVEVPVADYDALYQEFNPALFSARDWVAAAEAAGMKYLVITTKHHDGFCLWDSAQTDYKITATPFGRDVVKELAEECRRRGILFGTYYSILDWHHPDYTTRHGEDPRPIDPSTMPRYVDYLHKQVAELVLGYRTRILWFDGQWEDSWTHADGLDLYAYCRGLDDTLLINNRVDKGRRDERGLTVSSEFAGDFGTPEQQVGAFHPDQAWESCITLCEQWAWKPNDRMKTLRECIQTLALTAGGGGNLLLNVGPMLDGRIERRQVERLAAIGLWLKKYGESIYGTRGGPFRPTADLASTRRGSRVYLHLLRWPGQSLAVPDVPGRRLLKAALLGGRELAVARSSQGYELVLPARAPNENDSVVVLEFDGPVEEAEALDFAGAGSVKAGERRR